MSDQNFSKQQGVKALKKYDMKVSSIVFMIYCLVAAGAFGIEEMIPASGPGMTLLMLIIFPVIWAFPISNLVAECGSLLPSSIYCTSNHNDDIKYDQRSEWGFFRKCPILKSAIDFSRNLKIFREGRNFFRRRSEKNIAFDR